MPELTNSSKNTPKNDCMMNIKNKEGKQGGLRGVGACVNLAEMSHPFLTSQRTIKKNKTQAF